LEKEGKSIAFFTGAIRTLKQQGVEWFDDIGNEL
jgi:hypothetical protein